MNQIFENDEVDEEEKKRKAKARKEANERIK